MQLVQSVISWFIGKRLREIDKFVENPYEVQYKLLNDLLQSCKNTDYGKTYKFGEIQSYNQYIQQVPIGDYEHFKPYIERLLQGEQQLLWHSNIKWLAKSSGTTSDKSKFIPVSFEAMESCHYKAGRDVLALYGKMNPQTRIYAGKGIILGGSHQVSHFSNEIQFGDLSAVLIQNMTMLGKFLSSLNTDIALMSDWEAKIDKIAQRALTQNITSISGVPTWTLVLIQKIFEITGKNNLTDIFPNLELYIHGGVSFTPYRAQFKELIYSPHMNYIETYNASEGFFAIQDQQDSEDMLLMLDYDIFYEFIPFEDLSVENPRVLPLEGVEVGKNYAMLITTNSGMWRYLLGDTVRFTNINPHKIVISGRTKHFINAFGEEVVVDNADQALAAACVKTNAEVIDYTVAPVYMQFQGQGCHQWLIEFSRKPESITHFAEILDQSLQQINSDYEAKRYKDMALTQAQVTAVPEGTFYRWLKAKNKLGGQNKVPRLSNDRKIVEEILAMLEK
ncbi:MAG: GH3 auxin-responsive promoter family protein [Chitinophagales bacterium]|nr:GH3 auxin-responsive promoter family protein [Bacteroidota bacterium]